MNKVLCCGVFDPSLIYTASPYPGDNIFAKGFEKNNYQVIRFDYRASFSPNEELIKIANENKPDIFYFGKAEKITEETIKKLRYSNPNSIFIKIATDVRYRPTDFDLAHLKYMDLFVATFAGEYLKKHRQVMPSRSKAMSMITFTDSDFYKTMSFPEEWRSDVLWTGRACCGDNNLRNVIIDELKRLKSKARYIISIHGLLDWLKYPEYLYAINGTKIGICSNNFNRRKYSSDRLGNYASCGTFCLTQYIEGIEECFTRGENLEWFETIDEMISKIKFYLKNEDKRKEIASKSREFVIAHFDSKPLVTNILHVLETGKSLYKWDEIY